MKSIDPEQEKQAVKEYLAAHWDISVTRRETPLPIEKTDEWQFKHKAFLWKVQELNGDTLLEELIDVLFDQGFEDGEDVGEKEIFGFKQIAYDGVVRSLNILENLQKDSDEEHIPELPHQPKEISPVESCFGYINLFFDVAAQPKDLAAYVEAHPDPDDLNREWVHEFSGQVNSPYGVFEIKLSAPHSYASKFRGNSLAEELANAVYFQGRGVGNHMERFKLYQQLRQVHTVLKKEFAEDLVCDE